jgi:DSHCT (NUC185) domain
VAPQHLPWVAGTLAGSWARLLLLQSAADALKGGSLEAGPLGEVARQLNGSNELWLALALAAPGTSELQPPQLAALACGLVAADVRAALLHGPYCSSASAVAYTHCTL